MFGEKKSAGKSETGEPLVWMFHKDYLNGKRIEPYVLLGRRKIICVTTNEQFDSINEGSRKTGVHNGGICSCCSGSRKSAGKSETGEKLVWMYYENYLKSLSKSTHSNIS